VASVNLFTPRPFVPAPWLASPHAQTIAATVLRRAKRPATLRERWDTPDGDFFDVDVLKPRGPSDPVLLILHGLEGSSEAGYVTAVLEEAALRGMGAFAMNFRSCSGVTNRQARSYHSGETGDALLALAQIRKRTKARLFGIGFSLGANVLLRLLEETGENAPLDGGAAVSTPLDLSSCADALDATTPWATVYRNVFLLTLRHKALAKARAHPGILDESAIRKVTTLRGFDDVVTAPLHGFKDAADYYARSSSGQALPDIRRPVLLLQSKDDPFLPYSAFPEAVIRKNPLLQISTTEQGGHVGFIENAGRWKVGFWAEKVAVGFIAHLAAES
jgi:uncharacterized protein